MWFWIIVGFVLVAIAVMYWRSQRAVKASGNSLGGMQTRAADRRKADRRKGDGQDGPNFRGVAGGGVG